MKTPKQKNIDAYMLHQKHYQDRYDKFPPRVSDIDRAFKLYSWDTKYADLNILELWCCAGREYSYIREYTDNYLGIDIQDKTIDFAKKKYWSDKFVCADFENYSFSLNQDIVFAFASLLHCDKKSLKTMLEKIFNSLSDSWLLYISLKHASHYKVYSEEKSGRVFYLYSLSDIRSISSQLYKILYVDENTYNSQNWITLVLIKK